MTLVDASSLIDPSAEDLASLGLAEQAQPPPYAASPFPTRSLYNHGGLTWNPVTEMGTAENAAAAESEMSEEAETTSVVHHLQTDSVNTDCDLPGGMMMSPPRPRMNFSGEEALFLTPDFHTDMGGGMMSMSPSRMNYFSPPSGDSDPFRLWNFADDSEVEELENRKEMMMRPTWKQPCIEEVDPASASASGLGQNHSLGIWAAENMGGTVQTSVDEWFQLAGGMMPSSPMMMNYSLPSNDSLPLGLGGSFEPYSVGHELHNREIIMKMTISQNALDFELFSFKEFWLKFAVHAMSKGLPVAQTDVNPFLKFKYTTFSSIEVEVGIEQKSVTHLPRSGECGALEFLEKAASNSLQPITAHFEMASLQLQHPNSLITQLLDNLQKLATAELEKSNVVHILPTLLEAVCRMTQLDSPCQVHIPKSSATNNSIDAKGGNTHTISRWEKDHGITRQLLQQLFGKSRDDAAKTLKVSTSTLKRACRDFGINRWPNHKGKRPNCSLNQKQHVQAVKKHKEIQPCLALPPLQATNTSQCNTTMSVKVTYKNDTIRFPLSSSSTMTYLEEQLETKFKISLQNMSIKYQDEEDEWITLTCDSELLHGLDVLRSCGKTVIRMMVTPKFN